jgi:hypothetical protein
MNRLGDIEGDFHMDNDARVVNTSELFFVGDVRGNENPGYCHEIIFHHNIIYIGLLSLHILFLREHNRLARELAAAFPQWDDEKLFQEARRWNIAFMQQITANEVFIVIIFHPIIGRIV